MLIPFPTPQSSASIEAARNAMLAERAEAELRIGLIVKTNVCPACRAEIEGMGFSEGQAQGNADRAYAKHRTRYHSAA